MNKQLQLIGWGTLLGFPFLGFIIAWFFPQLWQFESILWYDSLGLNLLVGGVFGWAVGKMAVVLISMPFMQSVKEQYAPMIGQMNLSVKQIVFLSLCAGIGEEIFFRGFFQQWAGIWITAIVFVAIHGYLNPKNKAITVYGIGLTLAMAIVGYMAEYLGLISAILAHAIIDVVIFLFLSKSQEQLKTDIE